VKRLRRSWKRFKGGKGGEKRLYEADLGKGVEEKRIAHLPLPATGTGEGTEKKKERDAGHLAFRSFRQQDGKEKKKKRKKIRACTSNYRHPCDERGREKKREGKSQANRMAWGRKEKKDENGLYFSPLSVITCTRKSRKKKGEGKRRPSVIFCIVTVVTNAQKLRKGQKREKSTRARLL